VAAARLASALERIYCVGVKTNDRWLSRILRDARFLEVRHSIAFLEQSGGDFVVPRRAPGASRDSLRCAPVGPSEVEAPVLALAALVAHATSVEQVPGGAHAPQAPGQVRPSPWDFLDGFTPNLPARVSYNLSCHGHAHTADITFIRGEASEVVVHAPRSFSVAKLAISNGTVAASLDNVRHQSRYVRDGAHLHLWTAGQHIELVMEDPRLKEFSATAAEGGLTTPLPGVVVAVGPTVGQSVKAGDVLMVIEAMKMEHSIRAPCDGVVKVIHFRRGDRVPEGSQLLELAPAVAT
jgi:3-methylcrotonyl-CoA carboxylase alpha subunit